MDADVIHADDVGMVQRSSRPRFLLKTPETVAISTEPFRKDLDRNAATESNVSSPVHLTHAARANLGVNLIRAESGRRGQSHSAPEAF